MKEQNELDRLLRDSLDGFRPKPDPSGKEKFLEEASVLIHRKGSGGFSWRWLFVTAVFLCITGIAVYWLKPEHVSQKNEMTDQSFASHSPESEPSGYQNPLNAASGTSSAANQATNIGSIDKIENASRKELPSEPVDQDRLCIEKSVVSDVISGEATSQGENLKTYDIQDVGGREMTSRAISDTFEMTSQAVSDTFEMSSRASLKLQTDTLPTHPSDSIEATDALMPDRPANRPGEPAPSGSRRGSLSFGIYYKPELLLNIIDDNKLAHALGADLQFRFPNPRFIIRTGPGISFSKGYNEYVIGYNEYLGSYMRLDSVTFSLAENNFTLIPLVHQSEQMVFDTAVQALPSKEYQKFVYLQVPFIAGYEFFVRKNSSLGFRLGPAMSVLLTRNPSEITYEAGMNQVVFVETVTPERASMNWQLTAGLNFAVKGPKRTSAELEPSFNYYFKAPHQDAGQGRHPYSIGFRVAFYFR